MSTTSLLTEKTASSRIPFEERSANSQKDSRFRRLLVRPRAIDLFASMLYLLGGFYVTHRLWFDLEKAIPAAHTGDPAQAGWFFMHATRVVTDFENPFFTDRLNVPDGVNLMANTTMLGLGIPLTPVTLLFGPHISYVLVITLGLAGTAAAWYWLLSRHLVTSRIAAVVGAGLAAFNPAMISHATAHANFVAQFLLPFIVWRVICLREQGRWLRNGAILGFLITWQIFINEEMLLFTALACGVFVLFYTVTNWRAVRGTVRPFLAGLGVATGIACSLAAYPLWVQFFGPQSYKGISFLHDVGADLASFGQFARESISGSHVGGNDFAFNATEENTYLGLPFLVVIIAIGIWLWRSAIGKTLALTALVFAVLSLGPTLFVLGKDTNLPLPWALFQMVPPFDAVLPSRFGLVVFPIASILVSLVLDKALESPMQIRWGWCVAVLAALLPIAPTPVTAVYRNPTPAFLAEGTWREYIREGHSLLTVPLSDASSLAMRWQSEQRLEYRMARGYFLGPSGETKEAVFGGVDRPTSVLLERVAKKGKAARVTGRDRENVIDDLRYWRVDLVIFTPEDGRVPTNKYSRETRETIDDALRSTMEQLLGPGEERNGSLIWDVRYIHENVAVR